MDSSPIDAATTRSGGNLYVLNGGAQEIVAFRVDNRDGVLGLLDFTGGLPAGTDGLGVR